MAKQREGTGSSPLVLLSLCLSLLAVAFSAMALLMVYDQVRTPRKSRESLEIRAVEWNWDQSIGRMEKYLERLHDSLRQSGEESYETAGKQMAQVRGEMEAWVKTAKPRMRETVGRISGQVEELGLAVKERSGQAAEKLEALRESLRGFRKQVGQKKTEESPEKRS